MSDDGQQPATWNDDPLKRSEIPGRRSFAASVAARIDECVLGQGSTVFGLVGPWGSGKSTLLGEVLESLSGWKVVWFTPWAASDVGSVTAEFIATLRGAFPEAKGLGKSLAKYSRFGTPALGAIPVVGGVLTAVADRAITELAAQPAWHVTFEKVSQEIVDQRKRVLVVVDDVDRLDPEELRALLRVIRLLGRFKNVHYLLAYDQSTIEQLLAGTHVHGASSEFMEKIVQHPFEVPPVPLVERRRWCRQIVEAHSAALPQGAGGAYETQRDELVRILADGIETPRAASRLREQLDSLKGLSAAAEVDPLDFIALTWLRLSHHSVWDDIRGNPTAYLGWSVQDSDDALKERLGRLASLIRRGRTDPVRDAVKFLFAREGVEGTGSEREWRIQNMRYYQRYFVIGITDEDVSERLVRAAVEEILATGAGNRVNEFQAIVLGEDGERSALALGAARGLRRLESSTSRPLLRFIADLRMQILDRRLTDARRSPLDRWVLSEIYKAVSAEAVSDDSLIDTFGYELIIRSAYGARREPGENREEVRALYRRFAMGWVQSVADEDLRAVVSRPEFLFMNGFLVWLQTHNFETGYLSQRVKTLDDLITTAQAFVGTNEWVGSSLTYEMSFDKHAFILAVGDAPTRMDLTLIPSVTTDPTYETEDRPTPDISAGERKDFALRSLQMLYSGA